MSKIPVYTAVRLIPREADYLDRKSGTRGEIFFDTETNTLRLYNGVDQGGYSLARNDLSNVTDASFAAKASSAGIGGGGGGSAEFSFSGDDSTIQTIAAGNSVKFLGGAGIDTQTADDGLTIVNTALGFKRFSVSGQSNVDAGTIEDTITLVGGSNITITTDAETKTITLVGADPGGGEANQNAFSNIAVSGQSTIAADSTTDTLTLVGGDNISIQTDASTDTITISTSAVASFSSLTDATSAGLTIDEVYLPAITMLEVTNVGATAYRFDQYGAFDNPTIYAINRTTIAFKLTATGHPFLIQTGAGVNYNTGLVHVSTTGTVTTGSNAQGKDSGTLYWKIPSTISGGYRYQCGSHAAMVGSITIKDFVSI